MNRQRLDSPLVYVGAHNVYYVKLTVKVLYFTIHIHTQINQYVVISEFIKSNKLLVVYLNVEFGCAWVFFIRLRSHDLYHCLFTPI